MAKSVIKKFDKTFDQVFYTSLKAVKDLGYKIEKIDKDSGSINFKTGLSWNSWLGQFMSISISNETNDSIEVSISGVRNKLFIFGLKLDLQIYDWDESKKIAHKVFEKMENHL
ncbi:hypothetical protein FRE64_07610 [Euhalothece natronophila Z-M001]|uniref:Uncharacterized protein n=1 Tax=Euhalothece natronophila Z-M001 TaxID=522448 RepID=A0A5B8NLE6_9CHRO|nr:hypothetical protein [Euhalothece natronophila]QDZ39818.1 hypothetical protein FRE64_07610 [Euhalothece natronophila Z-M001]